MAIVTSGNKLVGLGAECHLGNRSTVGDAQQFAPPGQAPDMSDAIASAGRKQRVGGVEGNGNG